MRVVHSCAALIGIIGICVSSVAGAQANFDFGKQEFMSRCASCHGAGGKGDGVLRGYLTKSPTDLTAISKKNHGVFPYQFVSEVIDGRHMIPLHGGDMPIWGDVFQDPLSERYATVDETGEQRAERMIRELIYFLETIQADPEPEEPAAGR